MTEQTRGTQEDAIALRHKRNQATEDVLMRLCRVLLGLIILTAAMAGGTWIARTARAQEKARSEDTQKTGGPAAGAGAGGEKDAAAKQELNARFAAAEKESQEHIDKDLERAKTLLDVEVTLVGVYSALLGVTAFVTVKFSRDDAKEQLQIFQKKLDEIGASFPQFEKMDERVRQLLGEIVVRMPSEDDWNDEHLLNKIDEIDQQYILDSEIVVSAASVFALERAPGLKGTLFEVYTNFARFHDARYLDGAVANESDFARAVRFADRAVEMQPKSPVGYRRRGAIRLDGYKKLDGATTQEEKARREKRLADAEKDLDEALKLCKDGAPDAGAYYNRALAYYYRAKLDQAIDLTEELLKKKDKIPVEHWSRFMPYVYSNLGGFYAGVAIAAKANHDAVKSAEFSDKAVKAVERGTTEPEMLSGSGVALERLKAQVRSELSANQELNQLDSSYVARLKAML